MQARYLSTLKLWIVLSVIAFVMFLELALAR
jgi:hypothetical protein